MTHSLRYLRQILILLTVLAFCPNSNAQSTQQDGISLENRRALQFGVGSNLTLTSAENAVLSYKWMTSDSRGYRMNLSLSADYEDRTIDRTNVSGSSPIEQERAQSTLDTSVGATFEFMRYHEVQNRLFLYTLAGPTVHIAHFSRVIEDVLYGETIDGPEVAAETRNVLKNTQIGGGGTAGIGLEWFVNPYISFSGEYALALTASYRISENTSSGDVSAVAQNVDDRTFDFSLRGTGARVRLSVYF